MNTSAPNYHFPAEWEPHAATWLGWPHNRTDWPGKFTPIHWVYGEIVRRLIHGERVRIIVKNHAHESQACRLLNRIGADISQVDVYQIPTNRGWTRDFGPIFIRSGIHNMGLAIADFTFNAWAKYDDWKLDCRIPRRVAKMLGRELIPIRCRGHKVVLEGGSIDVNGRGTLMTTEECLLDREVQSRNPELSRLDIESVMRDYLGAQQILWLGRGIIGDDTHGHVDDICRFVNHHTAVLCQEIDPGDDNHAILEENRERLEGYRLLDGSKIDIVRIPMPEPLYLDQCRLPASYANFYIANEVVLVPTFNDPHDRIALGILAELFPTRKIIGIHAVDLVWGLGTIHCLSQQEPAD
jgi:agmatine deiminase